MRQYKHLCELQLNVLLFNPDMAMFILFILEIALYYSRYIPRCLEISNYQNVDYLNIHMLIRMFKIIMRSILLNIQDGRTMKKG